MRYILRSLVTVELQFFSDLFRFHSFVKNFIDRQSKVILTLKDERVVTVDVGLTTKNGLAAIEKEINERISNA